MRRTSVVGGLIVAVCGSEQTRDRALAAPSGPTRRTGPHLATVSAQVAELHQHGPAGHPGDPRWWDRVPGI